MKYIWPRLKAKILGALGKILLENEGVPYLLCVRLPQVKCVSLSPLVDGAVSGLERVCPGCAGHETRVVGTWQ